MGHQAATSEHRIAGRGWESGVAERKRAAKQRSTYNDGNLSRYWFLYSSPEMGETPSLTLSKSGPTLAHRLGSSGKELIIIVT